MYHIHDIGKCILNWIIDIPLWAHEMNLKVMFLSLIKNISNQGWFTFNFLKKNYDDWFFLWQQLNLSSFQTSFPNFPHSSAPFASSCKWVKECVLKINGGYNYCGGAYLKIWNNFQHCTRVVQISIFIWHFKTIKEFLM